LGTNEPAKRLKTQH